MTDSPVPVAAHHHPDLSIDQRLALRTAATRLQESSPTRSASKRSTIPAFLL